jgi:hypothetical protein
LLGIEPKFWGSTQGEAQLNRHFRGNGSPIIYDPIDDFYIAAKMISELFLGYVHRLQKFLGEYLSRKSRFSFKSKPALPPNA